MTDDSAARIEAQQYYIDRYFKARNFRLSGQADRRRHVSAESRQTWGRPWFVHNPEDAYMRRVRSEARRPLGKCI